MRESAIERKFVNRLRAAGCLVYKFISPGNDGVPDRIVITPEGQVVFVELKTEKGRLSEVQKVQLRRLQEHGAHTEVLYGVQEVEEFVETLTARTVCDTCKEGKKRGCGHAAGRHYDAWGEGLGTPDWCPQRVDELPFG